MGPMEAAAMFGFFRIFFLSFRFKEAKKFCTVEEEVNVMQ